MVSCECDPQGYQWLKGVCCLRSLGDFWTWLSTRATLRRSQSTRSQTCCQVLFFTIRTPYLPWVPCPTGYLPTAWLIRWGANPQFHLGNIIIIEGSLEVKLPTIWRDEKAVSREKSQKRKDQKKEDAGARKGRKVAKHYVFSWFCGSGGLKSRLAKAAGAETSGEMRDEKLHAVVARSTFGSKLC